MSEKALPNEDVPSLSLGDTRHQEQILGVEQQLTALTTNVEWLKENYATMSPKEQKDADNVIESMRTFLGDMEELERRRRALS